MTVNELIERYSNRQQQLEPFVTTSPAAANVYEQLEIQKALFEMTDFSAPMSNIEKEQAGKQLKIADETLRQCDRLIQVLKGN